MVSNLSQQRWNAFLGCLDEHAYLISLKSDFLSLILKDSRNRGPRMRVLIARIDCRSCINEALSRLRVVFVHAI